MSRYLVMRGSTSEADYRDPLSFPIRKFKPQQPILYHELTQAEVERIDLLMERAYGTQKYLDFVLFFNRIQHRDELTTGFSLALPAPEDLSVFFQRYRV